MKPILFTLNGTVTDHDGLKYSIGETVGKAERHAANVAYYTDPAKFRGWDLLDYSFDECDDVSAQTHHKRG